MEKREDEEIGGIGSDNSQFMGCALSEAISFLACDRFRRGEEFFSLDRPRSTDVSRFPLTHKANCPTLPRPKNNVSSLMGHGSSFHLEFEPNAETSIGGSEYGSCTEMV